MAKVEAGGLVIPRRLSTRALFAGF
jgi:excisionase family DNA binding protein